MQITVVFHSTSYAVGGYDTEDSHLCVHVNVSVCVFVCVCISVSVLRYLLSCK